MMMIVGKKVEEKSPVSPRRHGPPGFTLFWPRSALGRCHHRSDQSEHPDADCISGILEKLTPVPSWIRAVQSSYWAMVTCSICRPVPGCRCVHGAFVDDDEVHRVVSDWKIQGEPAYLDEILDGVRPIFIPGLDPASAQGPEW